MSGVELFRAGALSFALAGGLVLGVSIGPERAQAQTTTIQPAASGSPLGAWWAGLDPNAPAPALPPAGPASRLYGGAEYLLWWVKDAPLPVPLITTGPIETTHHGWIINSDTTILYGAHRDPATGGNDSQSFPGFNGTRLTLGYWLDDAQTYAIEGRGFLLQTRSAGYSIYSDQNGLPVINIPNFTTIPYAPAGRPVIGTPSEDGIPPSLPDNPARFDGNAGIFAGGVAISNSLRFWGADATGVMNLYRAPSWEFSALGGFRYLDLAETFNLLYESTGVTGAYTGSYGAAFDVFQTRNRFYGASLGLRGNSLYGPFSVEMSGRVSLGVNHQLVNIYGGYQAINFVAPGVVSAGPEGFFAQPANSGRYTSNEFALVPEAQVKLGYDVTPAIRFTVGYDVLYESSVVRPGDQINRNLPKGQTFLQNGGIVSSSSPTPLFNRTDFYAHGLTAGVSFRF